MSVRPFACATLVALASLAPPARALDLPTALAQVAAANPTLAARRQMADAAHARIAPAGAWSPPMLEAGLVNAPVGGALDMDDMTMRMVGVAQKLPLSGANGLARRAAREAWVAERAGAEDAHWSMLGEAWQAYADAWWAGELARCAAGHGGTMDALVGAARARVASGRARWDEIPAAEAERARTRADLADWRAEAASARARLDAMRGVDAAAAAGDTLAPVPEPEAPDSAWLAGANAAHPRLRAAEARQQRWSLGARAARRMAWPDIEVRASYGWRAPMPDGMTRDAMYSVTGAIMLPLFARSREGAEGVEMDAMARAAGDERRADELALRAGIAQLLAQRAAARERVSLLTDTVLVARRAAFDAVQRAWSAGLADFSRVLDAEHALYAEETSLVRARQQLSRLTGALVSLAARGDLAGFPLPAAPRSQP